MRGLMGTFELMPLQDLVELLARRQASGNLTCERGTVRKTLHLVEGVAVGASSNDPREYLGQLLMNFGHIDEEQLAKAFETQEETKVKLGQVLTMVGLVTPDIIRDTLAIKIRETLLDAFVWDSGVFRVEDAPRPTLDDLDPRVPLADIAREAEFRTTAWQAFRAEFPTGGAVLAVHEDRVPIGLVPGGIDDRLLALAREGKSIDEIGVALHATDFHLYQRLYALSRQGALASAGVPSRARDAGAASAGELADRAAALLADGRSADAEALAAQAAELAPGHGRATAVLADARAVLGASLRSQLLDPPRRPRLKVTAHDIALMRLSAPEKYLLGRCDGSRDLRQIVKLAPLAEIEVLKAVKKFVDGRIVEVA